MKWSLKSMTVHLVHVSIVCNIWFVIFIRCMTSLTQRIWMCKGVFTTLRYCVQQKSIKVFMMTSSNGSIFRISDPLCGEFTGHRWFPQNKGQWRGALMSSLTWARINDWVSNRDAGDLIRHLSHYDVIIMFNQWTKMHQETDTIFTSQIEKNII